MRVDKIEGYSSLLSKHAANSKAGIQMPKPNVQKKSAVYIDSLDRPRLPQKEKPKRKKSSVLIMGAIALSAMLLFDVITNRKKPLGSPYELPEFYGDTVQCIIDALDDAI